MIFSCLFFVVASAGNIYGDLVYRNFLKGKELAIFHKTKNHVKCKGMVLLSLLILDRR